MDIKDLKNKVIAHRGIHNNKTVPENSIKAFEKALKKNIPIELDVHILKDNTLVVFHDDNLKRMTHINKKIRDYTYPELEKITLLDTNYKIPTLKEVLNLVNGKVLLLIELKNDYRTNIMCTEVCKLLDNYKGEFIIQSFYPNIIRWFKKHKPEYIRGLLITNNYKHHFLRRFVKSDFIINYCSPNFLSVTKKLLSNKQIKKQKSKDIPIFTWTINNKNELNKYKDKADTFICNNL
ncbi:MAG: glycerophosphodiester phosphodiesterase [Bacilli bacterium]|nr:glycerophosphodiester phosphodiesterase [Bacilli bacterium]